MTAMNARVVVSAREGKVEIEGSELFVSEQLARLRAVIGQVVNSSEKWRNTVYAGPKSLPIGDQRASPFGKYADLYQFADGKIKILKNLPGVTMAHKTFNVALLVGHAFSLLGEPQAPIGAVRAVCKDHGCHDTNNFSSTIKRGKKLFTHDGWSQISLTEQGMVQAVALADRLLEEDASPVGSSAASAALAVQD